ncbi:DUF6193 family natural product biosynthesis protein [Streptomyces sp. NPDC102437]|uniref:DUF6193 family natural product biosynthesis protein n=1 Tax=Streptomyces sp. NPDC102437 TaxID=3366175 RepID=UPI00380728C2
MSHARAASGLPYRKALVVSAWAVEQRWSIRGEEPFEDSTLVRGDTDDLAQVARAVQGWQDGAASSDIRGDTGQACTVSKGFMGGDPLAEAATAAEAAAAAVRHLPVGPGPVTYGAPPDKKRSGSAS